MLEHRCHAPSLLTINLQDSALARDKAGTQIFGILNACDHCVWPIEQPIPLLLEPIFCAQRLFAADANGVCGVTTDDYQVRA